MNNPYRFLFCLGIVGCIGAATDKDPNEECDTGDCSEDTSIPVLL